MKSRAAARLFLWRGAHSPAVAPCAALCPLFQEGVASVHLPPFWGLAAALCGPFLK
ncbi:hypothetical protein HMPREF0372_02813 [Flavonifractor plautii ATCC 29863]|uniref:Uncharacterized protein n=1 Tax=Flavonifractor plautii ATCC 29863 TaxID=411475 RepID=G9YTF3_FLAPL|nr:hypothetical protein HMPREF0372_02813 [Flavonifractor plautii ATCC 29863]